MNVEQLASRVAVLERRARRDALSMVVFSDELDRLLAAFVIATGAAASGMEVSLFFTFWATAALKADGATVKGKPFVERAFGWMTAGGLARRRLSKLNLAGAGRAMLAREMKRKNVASLPELVVLAGDLGVEINVCEMSMDLLGIRREELRDYPQMKFCGVARFVEQASTSATTLFI